MAKLRKRLMDWISGAGGTGVVAQAVTSTIAGARDLVDEFVQTPDERAAFQLKLQDLEISVRDQAMQADAAILADRQSARAMAGTHGDVQKSISLTFVFAYFIVIIVDLGFVGFLVYLSLGNPSFEFPEWLVALISSTLTGISTAMSLKFDTVLGFLFGGSAGGDDNTARFADALVEGGRAAVRNNGGGEHE